MPASPEPLHLLIAGAASPSPPGRPPLPLPALAGLRALVARMRVEEALDVDESSLATPFEQALARAHGLPGEPGRIPWAAFETGTVGSPCAWFSPCHWQVGLDQVSLIDPAQLDLAQDQSIALMKSLEPLLAADGIRLRAIRPEAWLAEGMLLQGLATVSMARAQSAPLTPQAFAQADDPAQGARLRRLQSEIQMLLYRHPVNNALEAEGRWSVNAVWISGTGMLAAPLPHKPGVVVEDRLQNLPADADPSELARAWQAIEAEWLPRLHTAWRAGRSLHLTLCAPGRATTLVPARGLRQRVMSKIRPLDLDRLLGPS